MTWIAERSGVVTDVTSQEDTQGHMSVTAANVRTTQTPTVDASPVHPTTVKTPISPAPTVATRPLNINARKTGYVHRSIVTFSHGEIGTESGLIIPGDQASKHLRQQDGPIIVTREPGRLLALLQDQDTHPTLQLNLRLTDQRPEEEDQPWVSKARLAMIGWRGRSGRRTHKRMCLVFDASRFLTGPGASNALAGDTHVELMRLGVDVRSWCKENRIPIRTQSSALAAALSTDSRFIGERTAQVPHMTNESVRPFLPGVYMDAIAPTNKRFTGVWALDQRRAYHRAAQSTGVPNPQTLYARGYFVDSDEGDMSRLWATGDAMDSVLCDHGLFIVRATCSRYPSRFAPPAVKEAYQAGPLGARVAVWSTELELCHEHGLRIEGVFCAWTSPDMDESWSRYGRWAEKQIDNADKFRSQWLKPSLHARYGLAGARRKRLLIGTADRNTIPGTHAWSLSGRMVGSVRTVAMEPSAPKSANALALGIMQSAIRVRTLRMAEWAESMGMRVLHVHADGLHVEAEQLPLMDATDWTAEPLTNLSYEDAVSWTSDQRDVLPGRDMRARVELRRMRARSRTNVQSDRHAA